MKSSRVEAEALKLAHAFLQKERPGQREAFDALARRFASVHAELAAGGGRRQEALHLTARWKRTCAHWEKRLLPVPDMSFLARTCSEGMTSAMDAQAVADVLRRLRREIPAARLKELLREDAVGGPPDVLLRELSSRTQLHHLNDLTHFFSTTRCEPREIETVVEWGGGYGCMAKVFRRFRRSAPATYVIVDSSLMSCVQWLYLASIFGENEVRLLKRRGDPIRQGKINLLPLRFLEPRRALRADLFVSTYALSESSEFSIDRVLALNFFGAKRFLLAYSGAYPGSARKMRRVLEMNRARVEKTPSGDFYAFR